MTTLLLADGDTTPHALTAALALGEPVQVVDIATQPLAEPLAAALVAIAPGYSAIVGPATSSVRNVLPRVAALLDSMMISEVTEVVAPDTFCRPIYAGNAVETVRSRDPIKLLSVRTTAFAPTPLADTPVVTLPVAADPALSRLVTPRTAELHGPELASARIVVAGGRAFGSKEQFDAVLLPLAQKLGAAVGASRAAVDAGYAANELQVGQTGRVVAPELYIACGISGAIQHLAGMKASKVIVAINSDPEAPIFAIADYGLVGDIFTLVPELTRALP